MHAGPRPPIQGWRRGRRDHRWRSCVMAACSTRRDIYLKIEQLDGYSPLAPVPCSRRWGRDAMFMTGHELGRVQPSEIVGSTLDALVYREYFDGHYTIPNTSKLVEADLNEP